MKRYVPILLIISIIVNLYTIGVYTKSMKYDKMQANFSIIIYMESLKSFNEYIDIYLKEPDNTQILDILIDQENEMVKIATATNYYSLKKMEPLYSSIISITEQIQNIILQCKEGLDSREKIENLEYINSNLKDITSYFDEIQSGILSKKLEDDYLVKNQLLITNHINDILEKNKDYID